MCRRCGGTGEVRGEDGPCRCVGRYEDFVPLPPPALTNAARAELERSIRRVLAEARAPRTELDAYLLSLHVERGHRPSVEHIARFTSVDRAAAERIHHQIQEKLA